MKLLMQLVCMLALLLFSFSASATTMCSTSDVMLTDVQLVPEIQVDPFPNAPATSIPPVAASECVGLLAGNDKPAASGSNIGEYGNGLLNGEVQGPGNPDGSLSPYNTLFDPFYNENDPTDPLAFDGTEGYNPDLVFIEPSDLQDWDGDTNKTDPGWVYLGKDEGGFDYATTGDGPGKINIGDVVDIDFSCAVGAIGNGCTSGTWSVMPDFDIATQLFDLFGEGVFDHLAFVFKTGNVDDTDKGSDFAIYDFNFNTLLGGGLDLTMPYNLGGTFDLGTTFGDKGISHISVWARDPVFFKNIPEPNSSLLILLGVALLVLRFKSKHSLL